MAGILWISYNNDGAAIANRMYRKGFPVSVFFWDPFIREKGVHDGLTPCMSSIEEGLRSKPDAVIFDSSDLGFLADSLRQHGIPTWGAGTLQDDLEHDRGWGIEIMHKYGIRIPQTIIFGDRGAPWQQSVLKHGSTNTLSYVRGGAEECKQVVQELGGRWVLKPFSGDSSADTFVAESPEEMVGHIDHCVTHGGLTPNDKFLIQKVVKGIEISTEVWVQNGVIVPGSPNATIEEKKFLPRNLGPNTGAQSSLVWGYDGWPTILAKTFGTKPFADFLLHPRGPDGSERLPFHGPLDLNCIISEEDKKPYALEWTPRMGWNAYYALAKLMPEPLYNLFLSLAQGKCAPMAFNKGYAYVIQVTIPPFPGGGMIQKDKVIDVRTGVSITGRDVHREVMTLATGKDIGGPTDHENVWLRDAHIFRGNLETAGTDGVVCDVSGVGPRIESARDGAHALAELIEVDNRQISRLVDGADRAIKDVVRLRDWKYDVPNEGGT